MYRPRSGFLEVSTSDEHLVAAKVKGAGIGGGPYPSNIPT